MCDFEALNILFSVVLHVPFQEQWSVGGLILVSEFPHVRP